MIYFVVDFLYSLHQFLQRKKKIRGDWNYEPYCKLLVGLAQEVVCRVGRESQLILIPVFKGLPSLPFILSGFLEYEAFQI